MRFRATVQLNGKTATGIEVPDEAVAELGQGQRPPVRVTIGSYSYRTTVARMGGRFLVSLSAENRAAAGVAAGDEVEVDLELDDAPRQVEVPADLKAALRAKTTRPWPTSRPCPTATARSGCAGSPRPRNPTRAPRTAQTPSSPCTRAKQTARALVPYLVDGASCQLFRMNCRFLAGIACPAWGCVRPKPRLRGKGVRWPRNGGAPPVPPRAASVRVTIPPCPLCLNCTLRHFGHRS